MTHPIVDITARRRAGRRTRRSMTGPLNDKLMLAESFMGDALMIVFGDDDGQKLFECANFNRRILRQIHIRIIEAADDFLYVEHRR